MFKRLSLSLLVIVWLTSTILVAIYDISFPINCEDCSYFEYTVISIAVSPLVLIWGYMFLWWLHWLSSGDFNPLWFLGKE